MANVKSVPDRVLRACLLGAGVLAVLMAPTVALCNSGAFLGVTAEPCYRSKGDPGSTITLRWTVLNTSSFGWGCDYCPAYMVRVVPSWPTAPDAWVLYNWAAMDHLGQAIPIQPGQTDSRTWFLVPGPPNTGTHHLDIFLCPQGSPGACDYPPVDQVRIPLECVEWPDLVVESGSVFQSGGRPGVDLITAVFRVKNLGPGPAVRSTWTEVRLSDDDHFDFSQADPFVVSTVVPPLAAGEFRDYCLWTTVPLNAAGGPKNVLFKCDVLDEIPDESTALSFFNGGENNNVFLYRPFTVQALEVTGSVSRGTVDYGDTVRVSLSFVNFDDTAGKSFTASVRMVPLSTPGMISPIDLIEGLPWYQIPGISLAPAGWPNDSFQISDVHDVPFTADTYSVAVWVPPPEGRPLLYTIDTLEVTSGTESAPDLALASGQATLVSGQAGRLIRLSLRVENQGDQPAEASQLGIYLQDAQGGLTEIATISVPSLGPGESHDVSTDVALPAGAPSSCDVVARCDVGGVVAESNEENNSTVIGTLEGATRVKRWFFYN